MNATVMGFVAAVLWSMAALLVVFVGNLPPFQVLMLSFTFALPWLIAFFGWRRELSLSILRRPWKDYAFIVGSIGCYDTLYYYAFRTGPPFEVNMLNYLWPIFLVLFIDIADKRNPNFRQLAGMSMGFLGCMLLMAEKSGGISVSSLTLGHLLALIMALVWAFYSFAARNKNYPPVFMVPVFILLLLGFTIMHTILEPWIQPTPVQWLSIMLLSLTTIGFIFWDYAMKKGNRLVVTSIAYFIPLVSSVLLVIGGYGAASVWIAFAGGLIVSGCIVVNLDHILKRKSSP